MTWTSQSTTTSDNGTPSSQRITGMSLLLICANRFQVKRTLGFLRSGLVKPSMRFAAWRAPIKMRPVMCRISAPRGNAVRSHVHPGQSRVEKMPGGSYLKGCGWRHRRWSLLRPAREVVALAVMKRWQRLCLSQIHLGIAGVNGVKMAPSATAAATTVINFPVRVQPSEIKPPCSGRKHSPRQHSQARMRSGTRSQPPRASQRPDPQRCHSADE